METAQNEKKGKWLYKPANMRFNNLKECKVVLGTNRTSRLKREGKLVLDI